MNFGELKTQVRRAVHDTLAVPASYIDETLTTAVDLTVRHHTRQLTHGDFDGNYAGVLEGVNRLVFVEPPVALRRRGRVTIPVYGLTLELDQREPDDGPLNQYWSVVNAT